MVYLNVMMKHALASSQISVVVSLCFSCLKKTPWHVKTWLSRAIKNVLKFLGFFRCWLKRNWYTAVKQPISGLLLHHSHKNTLTKIHKNLYNNMNSQHLAKTNKPFILKPCQWPLRVLRTYLNSRKFHEVCKSRELTCFAEWNSANDPSCPS